MSAVAHVESALFHEQGLQDDEAEPRTRARAAELRGRARRRGHGPRRRRRRGGGRRRDFRRRRRSRARASRGGVDTRRPVLQHGRDHALPFYGVCHVGSSPRGDNRRPEQGGARRGGVRATRADPRRLAQDVARALQQGASPRGVRVVVAGSQMAPTGPRPVFADAAIGCLATEKADGEEERDAREYRAEFRACCTRGWARASARRWASPDWRASPRFRETKANETTSTARTARRAHQAAAGRTELGGGGERREHSQRRRERRRARGAVRGVRGDGERGRTERLSVDAAAKRRVGLGPNRAPRQGRRVAGIPGDTHLRGPRGCSSPGSLSAVAGLGLEAGDSHPGGGGKDPAGGESDGERRHRRRRRRRGARRRFRPRPRPRPRAGRRGGRGGARRARSDRTGSRTPRAPPRRARAPRSWRLARGTRRAAPREASETTESASPSGGKDSSALSTFFERDLELATLCEHHLLPFHGAVHVAYLADAATKPLTRAEAQRAVARHGRRFQVQERLTRTSRGTSRRSLARPVMVPCARRTCA